MLALPKHPQLRQELEPWTDQFDYTIRYVSKVLKDAEAGHDWHHVQRVYDNTLQILEQEALNQRLPQGSTALAVWGALLHDIADDKFHPEPNSSAKQGLENHLQELAFPEVMREEILFLIEWVSFKKSFDAKAGSEEEQAAHKIKALHILRDADRLDAIGAIGLARAFHYGGFKNRLFFDPSIPPTDYQNGEAYRKSTAPTINHFYEKLLLLKGKMYTPSGRELAEQRHGFLLAFLKQFYAEMGFQSPPPGFELKDVD